MATIADKFGDGAEEAKEESKDQVSTGPLSVLMHSFKNNSQVLINMRSGRRLLGRVQAFDRHCNMVLEGVKEVWTEQPRGSGSKKGRAVNRERFISKLFVRGDGVVVVLKNPHRA